MNMYWPIAVVTSFTVCYNLLAKATPANINPFASLFVTYGTATIACLLIFLACRNELGLFAEFKTNLNWVPAAFGLSLVGIEFGMICFFRAGWSASDTPINSTLIAVSMVIIGWIVLKEAFTVKKLIGVLCCIVGVIFINKG